jgi:hypothetical protein
MRRVTGTNVVPNLHGAGKNGFRSKDTIGGVPGTVVPAQVMNDIQEELLGPVEGTGLAPAADTQQLLRAIRSQRLNFVPAASISGSANAVILSFSPGFASVVDAIGTPVRFIAEAENTTAVTVSYGLATWALTWPDNTPLTAGNIKTGDWVEIVFDGAAARLLKCLSPREIRGLPVHALEAEPAVNAIASLGIPTSVITNYGSILNGLINSTFAAGILTIGSSDAGLYAISARLNTNLPKAGTSGTVATYSAIITIDRSTDGGATYISQAASQELSQAAATFGPFMAPTAILRLAAGNKIRATGGHNSGVNLDFPVNLTVVKQGS